MSLVEKLMELYVRMLPWLVAALVAVATVEVATDTLAHAVGIPYKQALTLVVGTLLLLVGLGLERSSQSRHSRR